MLGFKCIPEGHGSFSAIPPSTFGFPKIFPSSKMQPQPSTLHYFHKKTSQIDMAVLLRLSVENSKALKMESEMHSTPCSPPWASFPQQAHGAVLLRLSAQNPRTRQNGKLADQHALLIPVSRFPQKVHDLLGLACGWPSSSSPWTF